MQSPALLTTATQLLKDYWGHEAFRPEQIPPVLSLSEGKDTLAVMSTGSGKSICFQVPGLLRGGMCLVVSPLIALMSDQVHALKKKGIHAEFISSESNKNDVDRIFNNAVFGGIQFLYLAPERLKHPVFLARIGQMDIRTIAIDEAHCISQWGHDFRPAFREISTLRSLCPKAVCGAFTATATKDVADDISQQLFKSAIVVHRSPIRRANLMFGVYTLGDSERMILESARRMQGAGLIYAGTRRESHQIAERLKDLGVNAECYHAGLTAVERANRQNHWMNGKTQILTCTSAFGMGIDKNNVRWVFHAHVPSSLESYLQESGRAGRDGQPSTCIIFPSVIASKTTEKNLKDSFPPLSLVQSVYQGLANHGCVAIGDTPYEPTLFNLNLWVQQHDCGMRQAESSLHLLQKEGYIDWKARHSGDSDRFRLTASLKIGVHHLDAETPEATLCLWFLRQSNAMDSALVFTPSKIMRATQLSNATVTQAFEKLITWGWIQRTKDNDTLSIVWKTARIQSKELILSKESLKNRKTVALEKWRAVANYLNLESCRAQSIEYYFGEDKTLPCGVCDNCRTSDRPGAIQEIDSISNQGVPIAEWLWQFPLITHNQQIKSLYDAREGGEIRIEEDRIFPN